MRLLRFLRLGRLIQMLRYVRLALPVVRLARLGLFLLRLSDRLVRKHAGLLNRNIVLFEPSHAQRPESGDRHRLLALARRAGARRGPAQGPARPPPSAGGSRPGSWPTWTSGSSAAGRSVRRPERDPEGREGREIPVEALVDRLIQLSPERLIDRMGPAFVTSADRYLRLLDAPLLRRLPVDPQPRGLSREEPGRGRDAGRQLPGPPDPAAPGHGLLPRRPARHALAAGLPRPPGGDDRQRHAHPGQAAALDGLGVPLAVPDRQLGRPVPSRSGASSTSSRTCWAGR